MAQTASPVKPSDFEALLPQEGDTLCTKFKKLGKLAIVTWRLVKFMITSTGGITDEWATQLCTCFEED